MPCDDCSRAEGCPPCVNEPPPWDDLCGKPHPERGWPCTRKASAPHWEHATAGGHQDHPSALYWGSPEPFLNDRCKCSHIRFRHCYDTVDGPCSNPDCDCGAYAPVMVETVELPEVIEPVGIRPGCAVLHTDGKGNAAPCPDEAPPEPERTDCAQCGCLSAVHEETDCLDCRRCPAYRTEPDFVLPPQPERRPPLSIAYSVAGGHAYEVFIPGDASVTAEDGALIIQHPEAQVLAIVRVAPIKEA